MTGAVAGVAHAGRRKIIAAARLIAMESFYRGPARLISGGVEIAVEAALHLAPTDPETSWSGTIRSAEPGRSLWAQLEGDTATVRLPDGRAGRVLVKGAGFGPVEVSGEGQGPA
ncbi:DUF4873 domain-containing protein [Streptomyces sp. NPDC054796]